MTLAKFVLVVSGLALALSACAPARAPKSAPAAPTARTAPPAPDEGIVLLGPDGTAWVKEGVSDIRVQDDIDGCYRYAQAQIAHDVRIESDSQAAFDAFPQGLGWTELKNRQRRFERGNRRSILFTDCMIAKGYAKQ